VRLIHHCARMFTIVLQVLFTQSSAEFVHFYELLLARRLLRNRYISLSTEWRVLGLLPALSKSSLMIRDVEQTESSMHEFRNYVVDQIDFKGLVLQRDTTELALSAGRLRVHVLTGDVWPTLWLRPLDYAPLRLPAGMEQIKQQFVRFFDAQDTTRYESLKQLEAFKSIQISGSEENVTRVNGVYDPTLETVDGWPVYEMRDSDSPSVVEYSTKTGSWHIKKRSERGRNAGVAYCRAAAHVPLEQLDKGPWCVWKRSARKWVHQPIRITTLAAAARSGEHFAVQQDSTDATTGAANTLGVPAKRSRSLRRLIWCSAAGTVSLQATFSTGAACHLTVTEPQAALLLAFDGDNGSTGSAPNLQLTTADLQTTLNLSREEVSALLATLTTARYPILETREASDSSSNSNSEVYRLSAAFLSGALGGADEDHPIVLSSLELDVHHNDTQLFDSDLHSLHGWRNELIDACIVRTLKDVAAHKTGEFPNYFRQRSTALPIDTLTFKVRTALKDQCTVSAEDVIRRSERLVTDGIVDKVVGNSDTFRSVAYCYLSQGTAVADEQEEESHVRAGFTCEKLYGHDLFNHLRIVLGIKTLPSSAPGIPLALFREKFLAWIVGAHCDVGPGPDGRHVSFLDLVPGLLIELCGAAVLQANALKVQFWHGIQNLSSVRCPAGTFYQLPGIDSLQVMCNVLRTSMTNDRSNVHNYLCLDRVYFEHFPRELIQSILNHFRDYLGEPSVNYRSISSRPGGDGKAVGTPLHSPTYVRRELFGEDIDTEEQLLEAMEEIILAPSPRLSGKGSLASSLRQEIQSLWHRSAQVRKEELLEMLGGDNYSFLEGLDVVRRDAHGDEKGSPLEYKTGRSSDERPRTARHQYGRLFAGSRASSTRQQEFVKITLQQLISAVIQSAGMLIDAESTHSDSAESPTLAQLLDDLYFRKLVDTVAEAFDTTLHFAEDSDVDAQEGQEESPTELTPQEDEVYIPCEFCTDSIRMSLFAAHTLACQAGRALPADRRRAEPHSREDGRKPTADSKETVTAPLEARPHTLSATGLSFVESVLNAIVIAAADLQIPSELYSAAVSTKSRGSNFTSFMEDLFDQLDRDRDGFITGADFAVVERSYADIRASVDPALLYGRKCSLLTEFSPPMAGVHVVAKLPTSASLESLTDDDLHELSTPIVMNKVSSLWRSVSHEKSLPVADSSRSYAGFEEAEYELKAIVKRVMSIIDDSEGTTLSLLLHYKWDVKKLVEDVIENSRAVRLAVGLGPRSMPPFLRRDMFEAIPSASSRAATPLTSHILSSFSVDTSQNGGDGLDLCGICQDRVPQNESFAVHCRHWHCEGCWQGFIHSAINDRSVVYNCPQPNCKYVVPQDMQSFFADEVHVHEAKGALIK
jgi:hypothetical protein